MLTVRSSSLSDERKDTLTVPAGCVKGCIRLEALTDRLRRVRKDSGLGLRRFAERVSDAGYAISHAAVSDYERGEARVPAEYVAAVARAFDLSPAWILAGEGDMHPVEPDAKAAALDAIAEIVQSLKRPDDVADLPERRREIARRRAIAERWWRHLEEQAESGQP